MRRITADKCVKAHLRLADLAMKSKLVQRVSWPIYSSVIPLQDRLVKLELRYSCEDIN